MLFNLTDSLINEDVDTNKRNRAVRLIANSVFEKKHAVIGSRKMLDYLKGVYEHDQDIENVFVYLIDNYSFLNYSYIRRRIDVVDVVNIPYKQENNIDIYEVSYMDIQNTGQLQATDIVGENDNDGKFYKKIVYWYVNSVLRQNINCKINTDGGGGQTTKQAISNHIGNHSIFVSVVETDIKYPGCPPGKTSESCKAYTDRNEWNYKHFVIPVHEIENLIPTNFIKKEFFTKGYEFYVDRYNDICEKNPNLLVYYDLKKGIREEDLANKDYRSFAEDCCKCDDNIADFAKHCANVHTANLSHPIPIVYIYPPLRKDILEVVLTDKTNDFLTPTLIDFQESVWRMIGQLLLDFSCTIDEEALNS